MSARALHISGISLAQEKGAPRLNLELAQVTELGLSGDRLAGEGLRQISVLSEHLARQFAEVSGKIFAPGIGKENLLIAGLGSCPLRLMDRLQAGACCLEVTQVGKFAGAEGEALCPPDPDCAMSDYGVFARVIKPGELRVGMPVAHHPRSLSVRIITLSDRASKGRYEDKSGPKALELLQQFGASRAWRIEAERQVIQDDAELLEALLIQARQKHIDIVVTSGGTGMGPRDITPNVVCDHADRIIPGIMEHVRLKYGAKHPLALLSRSVAAVFGRTLVFALPGSPRAVEEYLHEIVQVLEHLVLVTRGLDPHR